ncbi:TPA: permease-like cell division protein FtsX [Pseudomonas aeruginosa]
MSANDLPRGPEEGAPERKTREKPSQEQTDWSGSFSAYLESHRASLVDSQRRLFGHPFGSFFTCLVMGITLSLPMGLSLLLNNVERLGGSWQRAAQISLFLDLKTSENQGQDLREQIERLPDVIEAQLISREQALSELQEQSGLGEALKELPENPLPPVISVTPKQIDRAGLEALRQQLAELPHVQQAQLDLVWVERLSAILKLGERFVFGLTILLVLTLLLVVGNTIRLHIENRRNEIEVIKLVGGTDGYVRRPFLYMGALYGLGAGILSWALLAYSLNWLNGSVVNLSGLYGSDFGLQGVPLDDGLSLTVGAVLLGWVGAWLAVARHLRELAPR